MGDKRTVPHYIEESGVIDDPIDYKWDKSFKDFDLQHLRPNPTLKKQLVKLSDYAVFALILGMSEWVAWRLRDGAQKIKMFDYLDAIWVASSNWDRLDQKAIQAWFDSVQDTKGPMYGPLDYMMNLVATAKYHRAKSGDPSSEEAVAGAQMVSHVLNQNAIYKKWQGDIIKRLSKFYLFKEDKSFLNELVLPKIILDPKFNYSPDCREEEIERFNKTILEKDNPFLLK